MSYAGFNLTASSGAQVPPSINELDDTAARANIQVNLNIRPGLDSADISLVDINKDQVWKERGKHASKPVLHPIHQMRVGIGYEETKDEAKILREFNEIVQSLPKELKEFFLAQMQLPPDQRNEAIVVLDFALRVAAEFSAWSSTNTENASIRGQTQADFLNTVLTDFVKSGLTQAGGTSVDNMGKMLNEMGSNHPNFDELHKNLATLESYIHVLKNFKEA